MRNYNYYFKALLAMLMLVSAPALAQSGARRNTTVTERQEANAERKQNKVNEAQKSTNVASQSATDILLRNPGGTSSDRRNGNNSDRNSGNNGAVNNGGNNGNYNGNVNNGNVNNGGNRPPVNNGNNNGNRPPVNNGGNNNRPPVNNGGGSHGGSFGGNHGGNYNGGYPGGYGKNYPGYRPSLPNLRVYERTEIYYRTNASTIVLRTPFRTKEEAYRYVERLLLDSDYIIGTYGNGYSWIQSEACFIPTPYDWTNPMTHNQFRIKVSFAKSFGYVQVTISGDWRESILSSRYSSLRFQPSSSYSTYYAWNVLEDLADSIPHSSLSYR